jgi:hypothetical protein
MIPVISFARRWARQGRARAAAILVGAAVAVATALRTAVAVATALGAAVAIATALGAAVAIATALGASVAAATPPAPAVIQAGCLASGDGYLRARLAGAINANIDWPNSGTHCEGESRDKPPGVRLSFQRAAGGRPDLLLVFGLTGVRAGKPAHAVGANLTIIVQGKSRIFGTLGDTRCTVDSLTQRRLTDAGAYRVEARGFCTQPAHAIRGDGDVLVSTFEFAGLVNYQNQNQQSQEK